MTQTYNLQIFEVIPFGKLQKTSLRFGQFQYEAGAQSIFMSHDVVGHVPVTAYHPPCQLRVGNSG